MTTGHRARVTVWNGNGLQGHQRRLAGTAQHERVEILGEVEEFLCAQMDAIVDQQVAGAKRDGNYYVLYALGGPASWSIPENERGAFLSWNAVASRVVAKAQNRIGSYTERNKYPPDAGHSWI